MDLTAPKKESRIPLTVPEFLTFIFQVIMKPRNFYQTKPNGFSFRIQLVKCAASHCNGSEEGCFLQFRSTNVDVLTFDEEF